MFGDRFMAACLHRDVSVPPPFCLYFLMYKTEPSIDASLHCGSYKFK
ncbi:hypothetical protein ISN44_As05g044940 [Arabidopsis suecica]|uniref:Uncharacterized protein n=1 Tax=Arabidopsis suecica TaxID=45249 RepID=A0A8T2DQC0_ARASU|nr:hypothetical protein ISN44_As05g044940 [Arabidopsis suecica]